MTGSQLKKAMEHVTISEDMQKEIVSHLNHHMKKENSEMIHWKKIITTAAAALIAIGIISIPVQAGIRYLVKERMESLPREEVAELSGMLNTQGTEDPDYHDLDSFSREYSQEEKARMAELYRSYQKGIFPEGTLPTAVTEDDVPTEGFCYVESTGRFLLPDRELTDEELLEIIDFNYKRDYALSQDEDVIAAKAAWKEEQERQRALVEAGGGINAGEALNTARSLLTALFGESPEGMEESCYLDSDFFDVPVYCVTLDVRSTCYYYFRINAADGSLVNTDCSISAWMDMEEMTEEAVSGQLSAACRDAKSFLENQMNLHEEYSKVYCLYRVKDGYLAGNKIGFYFIREDGSAHRVKYFCDPHDQRRSLAEYRLSSYEEFLNIRENADDPSGLVCVSMDMQQ